LGRQRGTKKEIIPKRSLKRYSIIQLVIRVGGLKTHMRGAASRPKKGETARGHFLFSVKSQISSATTVGLFSRWGCVLRLRNKALEKENKQKGGGFARWCRDSSNISWKVIEW